MGNIHAYLDTVESFIHLRESRVLEVGCGTGARTFEIGRRSAALVAIDPDPRHIAELEKLPKRQWERNISFAVGSAERLKFPDGDFDVVMYTLSFHHVPASHMRAAIDEALRVLKPSGHIVFLEPGTEGTFLEAEILFGCGDGDETLAKEAAYRAMRAHPGLADVYEFFEWQYFETHGDKVFIEITKPKKNLFAVHSFLTKHERRLTAKRRINIFAKKH